MGFELAAAGVPSHVSYAKPQRISFFAMFVRATEPYFPRTCKFFLVQSHEWTRSFTFHTNIIDWIIDVNLMQERGKTRPSVGSDHENFDESNLSRFESWGRWNQLKHVDTLYKIYSLQSSWCTWFAENQFASNSQHLQAYTCNSAQLDSHGTGTFTSTLTKFDVQKSYFEPHK